MDNDQTFKRIQELLQNVPHTNLTHEPTLTSEESAKVRGVSLDSGAKAMLLINKKQQNFFLCVMSASKKLSWKKIRQIVGQKQIDLASQEQVMEVTQCLSGAVPPFGSLFGLQTYCDQSLLDQDKINFNAGLRTESVGMSVKDYLQIEKPIVQQFCE
ncbi:hypothetical protein pb186bvf_020087 [Paramecium bursaria]